MNNSRAIAIYSIIFMVLEPLYNAYILNVILKSYFICIHNCTKWVLPILSNK